MSDKKIKKLEGRDKVQYVCAVVASVPFHLLFLFNLQMEGLFGLRTLLYLFINILLLVSMVIYMSYIYEESNKKNILKKLFLFEILPALLIFFLFVQGNTQKVGKFNTLQEYIDQNIVDGKDGEEMSLQ